MILIDISEPLEIEQLLAQSAPVNRINLNQMDMSDYYFGGADNRTRQFSRKQAGELLSSIDEAEKQLRDYYERADDNYQIVEGIISSVPITKKDRSMDAISVRASSRPNTLFTYSMTPAGFIHGEHAHNIGFSLFHAWLFQLETAGIRTIFTLNYVETAKAIATIYKNCQKPAEEHTTLQRYIKPRITIKHHNPHILSLMGLAGAELGETRATALIDEFETIFNVFVAAKSDLCSVAGIGEKTASKLLKAIGRE